MQVKTQPFKEALEIKSDGISFDIYGNGAKRLGGLAVTKGGLVWNKVGSDNAARPQSINRVSNGKAPRAQSINVRWEEFINWVQTRRAEGKNGGVVKLSAPKSKETKIAAKNGSVHKIATSGASVGKSASVGKNVSVGKGASAGKSLPVGKSTSVGSLSVGKGVSVGKNVSVGRQLAGNPGANPAAHNGGHNASQAAHASQISAPAKLPAAKLAQGKPKDKAAASAKKPALDAKAGAAARKKAN